jgi:hypothetical protein
VKNTLCRESAFAAIAASFCPKTEAEMNNNTNGKIFFIRQK